MHNPYIVLYVILSEVKDLYLRISKTNLYEKSNSN